MAPTRVAFKRGVVSQVVSQTSLSKVVQGLYDELLDAAWTRVDYGPVERERRRGPFSIDSVAGTLALATVDLVVLQHEASRAELYQVADDIDELARRPLALLAADAISTLLLLARASLEGAGRGKRCQPAGAPYPAVRRRSSGPRRTWRSACRGLSGAVARVLVGGASGACGRC